MSYATPIEYTITSPILLDAKIAEIQTALSGISWMTYSLARAYRHAMDTDGGRVYYPAAYQGDGIDYYNCFPNDNIAKAQSFVYVRQPQRFVDGTLGFDTYQADISIIVFFKLKAIRSTNLYHFTEELKYDIATALDAIDSLKINEVFDDVESAYADFTISHIESEFLKESYGALRFDCEVEYSNNCKITNTY